MAIYEVRVLFEAVAREQVERLAQEIEDRVCPHPGHVAHSCPNRWLIATRELGEDEAAEVDELLNG